MKMFQVTVDDNAGTQEMKTVLSTVFSSFSKSSGSVTVESGKQNYFYATDGFLLISYFRYSAKSGIWSFEGDYPKKRKSLSGGSVTLVCAAKGNPLPLYEWRSGDQLVGHSDSSLLEVG